MEKTALIQIRTLIRTLKRTPKADPNASTAVAWPQALALGTLYALPLTRTLAPEDWPRAQCFVAGADPSIKPKANANHEH